MLVNFQICIGVPLSTYWKNLGKLPQWIEDMAHGQPRTFSKEKKPWVWKKSCCSQEERTYMHLAPKKRQKNRIVYMV